MEGDVQTTRAPPLNASSGGTSLIMGPAAKCQVIAPHFHVSDRVAVEGAAAHGFFRIAHCRAAGLSLARQAAKLLDAFSPRIRQLRSCFPQEVSMGNRRLPLFCIIIAMVISTTPSRAKNDPSRLPLVWGPAVASSKACLASGHIPQPETARPTKTRTSTSLQCLSQHPPRPFWRPIGSDTVRSR